MTKANLNKLKCEIYKLAEQTNDWHTAINVCVRLGMLWEQTKEQNDKEYTIDDVESLFGTY